MARALLTLRAFLSRLLCKHSLSCGFVGVMASGLLPGVSNDAFAQCWCGPPGIICCNVGVVAGCEPITTPAARAMCPRRGGGAGPRAQPRTGGGARPQTAATIDPNKFSSTTSHQIQPLPCPRGFVQIGETFYGGTKCAPANVSLAPQGGAQNPQPQQPLPEQTQQRPGQQEPIRQVQDNRPLAPILLRSTDPQASQDDVAHADNLQRMHEWFDRAKSAGAINTQEPEAARIRPKWLDVPGKPGGFD
jgi:hypothetical protein